MAKSTDPRFTADAYNTRRFKPENYDFLRFPGPRAGEQALDFTLEDLDGNQASLSDFRGKWVVLETGSATCPMYTNNLPALNALADQYPDAVFLVLYVREAHPGERLPQHRSYEEKRKAATLLRSKYGERRRILVDTLNGDAHRKYSNNMPNIVYVINPQGIVTYRCDWIMADKVKRALDNPGKIFKDEHADTAEMGHPPMFQALKTMWLGGAVALWDFFKALKKLRDEHVVVDEYYKKKGRLDP